MTVVVVIVGAVGSGAGSHQLLLSLSWLLEVVVVGVVSGGL